MRLKEDKNKKIMFGLGLPEILLIALIVLLLFGAKRIPELMKSLGVGVKSFKEGMKETTDNPKEATDNSKEAIGKEEK